MWAAVYSAAGGRGPALAAALLDLAAQLVDGVGHRLLHPRELPVLDLDQPYRRGRGHGRRALLLLEQALLAEDVAGTEVGPGDVIGEEGLLEKSQRSATITATSTMRVIKIEHWELSRMKKSMPEVIDRLSELVEARQKD